MLDAAKREHTGVFERRLLAKDVFEQAVVLENVESREIEEVEAVLVDVELEDVLFVEDCRNFGAEFAAREHERYEHIVRVEAEEDFGTLSGVSGELEGRRAVVEYRRRRARNGIVVASRDPRDAGRE